MTTKLGRVVTYGEGKPCMTWHEHLVTLSRVVMRQIKNPISPLQQDV